MSITYFQNNIERFIPAMYRTGEFDGTVAFFQTVLAPILDELYQRAIDLPKLADIDKCPPQFLQLLAGNINTLTVEDTFNETQQVAFRRRELGKMVDLFRIRSTESSFLRILKYLGSTDYGMILPRKNLMQLDVTPISGAPDGETNDVEELLAPQFFDISSLADGEYDSHGILLGNRISYAVPASVIRSNVKLIWNDHEVPISRERSEGDWDRSFYFNRYNTTITTNFVPLIGDRLLVEVVGDPYYRQSYRMVDETYWRPGTEEVWSDVNPLLRYRALMDRRPIGTLLYFVWLAKFFQTKCFPFPPAIDYQRSGYAPNLPPYEDETWDPLHDCNLPDPWQFQISNGYGYEASWEARGVLQLDRQYPYTAKWEETGLIELSRMRRLLVDLGLVFDVSTSMTAQDLLNEKAACKHLVDAFAPLTVGGISAWSFCGAIRHLIGVSHDPSAIKTAIDLPSLDRYTKIYDAIWQAVSVDHVKSVILMTDGTDNASTHTLQQVLDLCTTNGVTIDAIGFGTQPNPTVMQQLTSTTGGTYYAAVSSSVLTAIINTYLKVE